MDKKQTTTELGDFIEYNKSEIDALYKDNPVLAKAFGAVLNAVSKEYGNGEDLDSLLKAKPWRFKTNREFVAEYGMGWTAKVKGGWNEDMAFLFGRPLTSEQAYGIQNMPPDRYYQYEDKTGQDWAISTDMITDMPLLESDEMKPVTTIEVNYIGMTIVNPKGDRYKIVDLQMEAGQIKIFGMPIKEELRPLKAKISKGGWKDITAGKPYNGWYISEIKTKTEDTEELIGRTKPKKGSVSAKGQSLSVQTIPNKLSYAITFESNKQIGGKRKSPTQSAGELYRMYDGTAYKDKIFETFFMGNDGAWWNIVEGGSTWRWKRANPQPATTKDYSTMTLVELKNAKQEAVEAKKYFDKDDPEYAELEENIAELDKIIKINS